MNALRIFLLVCELTRLTLVLLKASQKYCYPRNVSHSSVLCKALRDPQYTRTNLILVMLFLF